ncbi:MAG: XdhC family protein [Rhizobiales bacterium]|nr:XdhC family protein [Hyphomicrobiales bacterium]
MDRLTLKTVLAARAERRALAVVTELASGAQRVVEARDAAGDALADVLADGFRFDRSGVHQSAAGEVFVSIHNPPLQMIIVGAVHIAQCVTPIAAAAGYDVTVIDPRGAFASEERFAGIKVRPEWPDEVLPQMALDARTAFLALTHDPKIDDPALLAALASECFYIGALGSRRTQGSRLERLTAAGVSADNLDRIHGPIGLDIGARGAPEIAISIMAEVIGALRQGGHGR